MSNVKILIEFLEGGDKNDLFDRVAKAVCGKCDGSGDSCDGCAGGDIITDIEELAAQESLGFIKEQVSQWIKLSVEKEANHVV